MERDIAISLLKQIPHEIPHTEGAVHWIGGTNFYPPTNCPYCKLWDWVKSITILVD